MTFFGTDSILTLHIKKLGCYVFKEIHMAFCRYAPHGLRPVSYTHLTLPTKQGV